MAVTHFEDLQVWQEAASLAVEVYAVSKNGDFSQDFGFRDQLLRSAVSIAANIAEGKERETIPEFIRYLYIAKGSSGELIDSPHDCPTDRVYRASLCKEPNAVS